MSESIVLSRRRFLEVTAFVGGGLLVGCQLGKSPESAGAARSASAANPAAPFKPNAWITIESDGAITLVCARNEMGQDVHTSLAMLVAEELEVDPRTLKVVRRRSLPTPI